MSVSKLGVAGTVAGLVGMCLVLASPPALAQRGRVIQCESTNGKFNRCETPWRDAELVKQQSKGACIRGQSWGVDRRGLWVDRGCRGLFGEVRDGRPDHGRPGNDNGYRPGYGPGGGWRPGPDWDRQIRLQCDSNHNSYQMCQVDVGRRGHVQLVQRMSDARCIEGSSWGWNRAGVWVDRGCRARFVVDRRW